MTMLEFRPVQSTMRVHGFTSYDVFDGLDFIGQVFQYFADSESRTLRWLAQTRHGAIHGWLTPIRTRKAAGAVLLRERAS